MRSFAPGFYDRVRLSPELVQTLRLLGEHKGREGLFRRTSPQVLETLRKVAVVESTESSNRIEGIVASRERIEQLVAGSTLPQNRSEQEIAGYREVLATIHANHGDMPFTPSLVLQLHRDLYQFLPQDGGRFKGVDNEISETRPDGTRVVRFRPVSAFETPRAMEELHRLYARYREEGRVEPLLLVAAYVLDFLCIHPFLDGNGRMARLLSLLLLYKEGYEVGRYISLERVIERQREGYYAALLASSQDWHEGRHDVLPWWEFFLGVALLGAYRELESRTDQVTSAPGAKSAMVRETIYRLPQRFRIADVLKSCPGISRPTVDRVLRQLKEAGEIRLLSSGRFAEWEKTSSTSSSS